MIFNMKYFLELFPIIMKSFNVTVILAISSLVFSLIIGTIVALSSYYKVKVLNQICKVYVSIFRGTPLMPQLFFLYFGLAYMNDFVKNMDPVFATSIVLSLNMGAYMSETIRASILSIDKGQIEAAYVMGLTNLQTMKRIVIPQAVRVALPSLFNNFIDLIKGSSVAFVVGVNDIMGAAKSQGALSFKFFEVYGAVMVIYWCIIT
ncbi:TPA: amino acid ABC transporter permease, partial [Clostridioides difficile]|nr:amino acid ABC transporter permease [Clostridioides difficile]